VAKKKKKKKSPAPVSSEPGPAVRPVAKGVAARRRRIDRLDRDIVEKLNERAELSSEIGQIKQQAGEPIYAPEREERVINRAVELNGGPLSDAAVRAIYRELVSGSRAITRVLRVAFLGPEYSYSHLAAMCRFGQSVELVPVVSIAAVFEEVSAGQADFGLVPVENSTDGRVSDALEMFAKARVRVCGEVPLRIHHNLLGVGTRREVREVFSKPQALSQCRNWIARHLPDARPVAVASTSEAARRAKHKPAAAAIASLQAAADNQLPVLAHGIEDNPDNQTRFMVIADHSADRSGDDKTSLFFEIEHRPGALADAMTVFKRSRLNMTWIESFPIPGAAGRYLFFVEFLGHQRDLRVRKALASLEKKVTRLEVLGSYARHDPIE